MAVYTSRRSLQPMSVYATAWPAGCLGCLGAVKSGGELRFANATAHAQIGRHRSEQIDQLLVGRRFLIR